MVRIFFSPDYTLGGYSFDTTRKAKWIADSLRVDPIEGIQMVAPKPITLSDLVGVHSEAYLSALVSGAPRELAESQGFTWDEQLFPMVCSSTGGMVAAVNAALEDGVSGTLSSGLHHARFETGRGFCSINGLVVAAHKALAVGCRSILILDLDAHCGGGTAEMVRGVPGVWHLDISVHPFDRYENTDNSRLVMVDSGYDYLVYIEYELEASFKERGKFDLCIYNAGMDPHENCSSGGLTGITKYVLAQRERFVFDWCQANRIPIAFAIAGGYIGGRLEKHELVELHRLSLRQATASK